MLQVSTTSATPHDTARFWLDVADKAIKFVAVVIGGLWTWWNYRKARTYEQKLELEVDGRIFVRNGLFGDVRATVKNIGATKHSVSHQGTFCVLSAVRDDLTEERVRLFSVFSSIGKIEPGESMNDTHYWRIHDSPEDIVWIKLTLRVVSNGVEWVSTRLIPVERDEKKISSEET